MVVTVASKGRHATSTTLMSIGLYNVFANIILYIFIMRSYSYTQTMMIIIIKEKKKRKRKIQATVQLITQYRYWPYLRPSVFNL